MNTVKYYKDSELSVGRYALKRMLGIFGACTPIKRVSEYFGYPVWLIQEWETAKQIPEEDALLIIEKITKEKPETFITEVSQAIDFIKGD